MSELPFDGDLNDPRQRCKHGTFIGSWWGPDYLCRACEDGLTDEEVEQERRDMELEERIVRSEREHEAERLNRIRPW